MDEEMDSEAILFAEFLVDTYGEGGSFEFEGQVYTLDEDFREKLRTLLNKQLEEAISND